MGKVLSMGITPGNLHWLQEKEIMVMWNGEKTFLQYLAAAFISQLPFELRLRNQ